MSEDTVASREVGDKLQRLKTVFMTHKTKDVAWRQKQLGLLVKGLTEMTEQFKAALEKDLGRSPFFTWFAEILNVLADVDHSLQNVAKWAKDEKRETPQLIGPGSSMVINEPLGVVLVMSAWNFPILTAICPMVAAIAAGNCCLLKPSEMSPNTAKCLEELISKYLDSGCFAVCQGGPDVAIAVTQARFDGIIFTGSPAKGKIVAQEAAKNLIPCILELGGKCPVIVDDSADIDFAAKKIAFGRYSNSGQICLSPDYVLAKKNIKDKLIERIQYWIGEFYQDKYTDMGKMVNEIHCNRVLELLNDCGGKIIHGGKGDPSTKRIIPTIVDGPNVNSRLMTEEIFGPILPVLTWDKIDNAIDFVNEREKPLGIYYFGKIRSNNNKERLLRETSSGGFGINEVLFHGASSELPFGGVGNSGYGKYHGIDGFKAMSNPKAVLEKPTLNFYPFSQLFPPFDASKQRLIGILV